MFHLSGPAAVKLIIFVIASAGIIFISRASLRVPHCHGFFRFFTFESILVLILLNTEYWFAEPFSVTHIVSWLLLFFSLFLAAHGFYLLRVIGKPARESRPTTANFRFENTATLITVGPYKYIRHPLYCSLLLLAGRIPEKAHIPDRLSDFSNLCLFVCHCKGRRKGESPEVRF